MLDLFPIAGISLLILIMFLTGVFIGQHVHRRKVYKEIIELISMDQCYYTILDIREEQAFQHSHIETSSNMPFDPQALYFPTENMFERIIVIGTKWMHTIKVVRKMSSTGYANVSYFGAWRHWKGPVVRGMNER